MQNRPNVLNMHRTLCKFVTVQNPNKNDQAEKVKHSTKGVKCIKFGLRSRQHTLLISILMTSERPAKQGKGKAKGNTKTSPRSRAPRMPKCKCDGKLKASPGILKEPCSGLRGGPRRRSLCTKKVGTPRQSLLCSAMLRYAMICAAEPIGCHM